MKDNGFIMLAHNELSYWHRKPVYRIDDDGNKHWYPSLAEAGRRNYIADSAICHALRKHIKRFNPLASERRDHAYNGIREIT